MSEGLERLVRLQEQVLAWRQACCHLEPNRVARRIRSGRWQRPCHGVLVTHNGPLTTAQRRWIAVLAAGRGALLAGQTAALLCGLRGYETAKIHVLLPADRTVKGAQVFGRMPVVLHRTKAVHPRDSLPHGRPPHTVIARSLVDAAQWAPSDDAARAIVAAGFQQRLVRHDELAATLSRMPRAKRRRLTLETAGEASNGAHSAAEIDLVRLCRTHRLPLPTHQERRRDRNGRRRWLDTYWRQWRLHVEVDGSHHIEVSQWWADMWRQNALWVAGDRLLRFPSWAVRHRPAEVAHQIQTALAAAGWRPHSRS